MKTSTGACARCGKPLPADAPRELCPPCLLEAVLSDPNDFLADEPENETLDIPEVPTVPDFQIQQLLGTGGFGEVYSAEQIRPIRRPVAMKILKRGMNSRQVMKRFEAERQALALMDHPNIATVYDAGETADKRQFVTMELVKGPPVTTFCDREEWKIRDRLELFITICDAVQHAHQKGVIHRDLKPSNILVARDEAGEAAPRVIDFGIAKALDEPLTNQTIVTQIHQVMGTPAYMSPEQTDNRRATEVDTRSDIYALGVILYELLTGTVPFPKSKDDSVLEDWLFRIREDEPERPSQRLEKVAHGPRRTWIRETRGDLDWITLKALEKDPERRYDSARALADDIRRHLDFEPVLASPPGRFYRFRKMVRRHRVAAAFTASLAAAVIGGFAGTTWMYFEAENARQAEARAVEELAFSYSRSDLLAADQLAARGQSSQAVAILSRALRTDPDNRIARAYLLNTLSTGSFFRDSAQQLPVDPRIKRVEFLETDDEGSKVVWAGPGENGEWFVQSGDRCVAPRPGSELSAFSLAPDGNWFATGWEDGNVDLFGMARIETADEFPESASFKVNEGVVRWIEILPDSQRIALQAGGMIHIRNLQSASKPIQLDPEGIIGEVAVSGDGKLIIAGTRKGLVLAWNTETGEELNRINWRHSVDEIRLSFDGRLVALGSRERVAQVWNLRQSKPMSPPCHHPLGVTEVLISPDESKLVTGCVDGSRRVWDLRTERLLVQETPMDQPIQFIEITPTGRTIVGSLSGQNRVGHLATLRTTQLGSRGRTKKLTMNARGTRLYGWNITQARILGWHIRAGGVGTVLLDTAANFPIRDLSLDQSGQQLLAPTDRNLIQWIPIPEKDQPRKSIDLDGNPIVLTQDRALTRGGSCWSFGEGETQSWQLADSALKCGAIHPNGRLVAGSTTDDKLVIGDFETQTASEVELPEETLILSLGWKPREPVLVIAVDPSILLFYDTRSAKIVSRIENRIPVHTLTFTPDGKRLIAGSLNGNIRTWDLESRELAWSRPMPQAIVAVEVSGDGQRVLAGTSRGVLRLIDCETGLPMSPAFEIGDNASSLALDHFGEIAAIGCESGAVRWLRFPASNPSSKEIDSAFLEFAEHFGGWQMDEAGTLDRISPAAREHPMSADYAGWRDWLLGDPTDRPIFPESAEQTQAYLQQLLGGESLRMLQESARLRSWVR